MNVCSGPYWTRGNLPRQRPQRRKSLEPEHLSHQAVNKALADAAGKSFALNLVQS